MCNLHGYIIEEWRLSMLLSLHSLKSQTFYVFIKLACKELNAKRPLERVAVHAIPITVDGQAEGAVGGLAAAAATEKIASVAGNLVAGDGDVLEDALLHGVVVGIEGGDGELGQYVILGVWQGEDVEGGHAVGNSSDFSLLRVDATVASRGTESRRTQSASS